jgi:uncharacterized protein (TIGR02246 family)
MNAVSRDDAVALESILAEMEQAWNAGDGARFAAPFAADGVQVNIFGVTLNGREEIAARHESIFKSIFRGSRNTLRIVASRYVDDNILLARMSSLVEVPQGPLRGELKTLASLLFRRTDAGWELMSFHNTRIAADIPH